MIELWLPNELPACWLLVIWTVFIGSWDLKNSSRLVAEERAICSQIEHHIGLRIVFGAADIGVRRELPTPGSLEHR